MVARTGLSGKSPAGRFAASVRKAAYAGSVDMPPPRSLGRYAPAVRLRRAEAALSERATEQGQQKRKKKNPEKAAALPFFHRLRLPLAGFTLSEAFKPRIRRNPMWLQDNRRFRRSAPSCGLHIPAISFYRIPYRLSPLRDTWRFLIAHAAGISERLRRFAPGLAVSRTPPFSLTAAPVPVTSHLNPPRKDT